MSAFFSKAAVQKHPFRLSLNVCFRPRTVVRSTLIQLPLSTQQIAPDAAALTLFDGDDFPASVYCDR